MARDGARKMLALALENEVAEFIEKHSALTDESGNKAITRNGYMPARQILTGMGPLEIKQPRVDDRALKNHTTHERFTSNILPRYLRRIPSIDNLIPCLYLKGISVFCKSKFLTFAKIFPQAPVGNFYRPIYLNIT